MPVSITRLKELVDLARSEGVEAIDTIENGMRIRISRNASGPVREAGIQPLEQAKPTAQTIDPTLYYAPMFGVLHLTPAPDAKAFITIGDHVKKGQQLCLIEAMKMFNACYSDRDGRVDAILAKTTHDIARGQPLFRIIED
jgi:acetyl-CoA carboxylase biotin carboxyl carrier protein